MKRRISDLEKELELEDAFKKRRELLRRPRQQSPSKHGENMRSNDESTKRGIVTIQNI